MKEHLLAISPPKNGSAPLIELQRQLAIQTRMPLPFALPPIVPIGKLKERIDKRAAKKQLQELGRLKINSKLKSFAYNTYTGYYLPTNLTAIETNWQQLLKHSIAPPPWPCLGMLIGFCTENLDRKLGLNSEISFKKWNLIQITIDWQEEPLSVYWHQTNEIPLKTFE